MTKNGFGACAGMTNGVGMVEKEEIMAKEKFFEKVDLSKIEMLRPGSVYATKLFVVALAGRDVIEGIKECDRYYFRVSKKRLNALGEALDALREPGG